VCMLGSYLHYRKKKSVANFLEIIGLNRERDEDSDTSSTIMEQSVLSSFAGAYDLIFHNCYGERVVVLAKEDEFHRTSSVIETVIVMWIIYAIHLNCS
jgi:hypothetical protein